MLAPAVQRYFQESLAPSTRQIYNSAMNMFNAFCTQYTVTKTFPATEHPLCTLAAHMADVGLSSQSIKTYLATVRNTQLSLELPDPRDQFSLPVLKRVQTGVSRSRLGRLQTTKIGLPIMAPLLTRIKAELECSAHLEGPLMWPVCCVACFRFFHLGELLLSSRSSTSTHMHILHGEM